MSNTMSIYAEALISNREYKNARVNGEAVGVTNARNWVALIKECLIPAYSIRKYRHDNMGNAEVVADCDQTPLYNAIRPVIALIGEVNGDKLNAENVANEFISQSARIRVIDTSTEMAHAHLQRSIAKKALNEDDSADNQAEYDRWDAECKRLEALPGNCKRIIAIQNDTAFIKAVELALGDAITKQTMESVEDILAKKAAKEAERKAKRKANKLAKKSK